MEKKYNANLLFALLSLMMFSLGLQVGGFNLVIDPVAAEYQLSETLKGLLATFQYLAILVAPVLFGGLSDRLGRKNIITAFSLLFLVGCAFTLFVSNAVGFIIGVFLIGAGASVTWSTISAALGDAFTSRAGRFISFSFMFYSLGAVVSPQVINFCMGSGMDWRSCYWLAAIAVLISLIIVLTLTFAPQPTFTAEEKKGGSAGRFQGVGSVLFIGLFLSMILYCSVENGLTFFAGSYFGMLETPAYIATAISAYWFMMIPARLLAGLFDKYRREVLIFGFVCMTALLVVMYTTTSGMVGLICMGAIGFVAGPLYSTLIGLGAESFPKNAGTMTSLITAGQGIGGAASPFLMGLISDSVGTQSAYLMLALFGVVGTLCYLVYYFKSRATAKA